MRVYTLNPQSLEVEPCLAEQVSIDTSSNQHTYTFTIKKGVYFHDDPCLKKRTEISQVILNSALIF